MRIAVVTKDMHPSGGGPPRVVLGHALQLKARGLEPHVLATHLPGKADEVKECWPELVQAGIPFSLFERTGPDAIGRSPAFAAFLRDRIGEFDVMHIHGVWERCLAQAGLTAHRAGVPYVLAPHGMLDRWSRARSTLKKAIASRVLGSRAMMRHASAAQFGTEEERDEAGDLGMPWRPVIIPNGIFLERFDRDPSAELGPMFEEFPQLRGRSPLMLFYSRMHPKKGVDLLLEAMAGLAKDFPEAGLLVAALAQDAPYESQVRERALREDLADRVAITTEYTGEKGMMAINASDIFVLPSHQEGFSMAIVEAMAYRMPVAITEPCHMGVVAQHDAGSVVPVAEIERGLRDVVGAGPDGWSRMGANGREWVERHCTWEAIGEKLETTYRELIAAPKGRGA